MRRGWERTKKMSKVDRSHHFAWEKEKMLAGTLFFANTNQNNTKGA
jgi:hypothetical protein